MDLSIVIPTYNEGENVIEITKRIQLALAPLTLSYEICFVDDSTDETTSLLENLSQEFDDVRYIHRENGHGLATAVVEGFKGTTGQYIVVMDSDLQHPPEILPQVYGRLTQGIEVVIPSRFIDGGSDGGLRLFRKVVSWTARSIGRVSIRRLRNISDCTGGYFAVQRHVVENVELDPVGWKILMEVLVKGKYSTVHEIPYSFVERQAGESKMSMKEQWNYLHHIVRLVRFSPDDRRFYMFCLVGLLGVAVNLLAMSVLLHVFHRHILSSSIAASLIAMAHNFLWNDRITWRDHVDPVPWRRAVKFPLFVLISTVGIAITGLFAQLAVWTHVNELLGQLVGILISTAWGYTANNKWTWNRKGVTTSKKIVVTQGRTVR